MVGLTLTLAPPPSVNHYWQLRIGRQGHRKYSITKRGLAYRRDVGNRVLMRLAELGSERVSLPLRAPLSIVIYVTHPDRRRRDLDNLLKALLDALEHNGVVHDDADFSEIVIRRTLPGPAQLRAVIRQLRPLHLQVHPNTLTAEQAAERGELEVGP